MIIMLDTNILISAGIFSGSRLAELTKRIAVNFTIILSSQIIEEFRIVVSLKFPHKKEALETFIRNLHFETVLAQSEIDPDIYPKIRDKKDYPILASAILADVDVFITGDKDFTVMDIKKPKIMTMEEFAVRYLD